MLRQELRDERLHGSNFWTILAIQGTKIFVNKRLSAAKIYAKDDKELAFSG